MGRPKSHGSGPDHKVGSTGSSRLGSGGQTSQETETATQSSEEEEPVKPTMNLPLSARSAMMGHLCMKRYNLTASASQDVRNAFPQRSWR